MAKGKVCSKCGIDKPYHSYSFVPYRTEDDNRADVSRVTRQYASYNDKCDACLRPDIDFLNAFLCGKQDWFEKGTPNFLQQERKRGLL